MADFATIERRIWADGKFLALSERAKLLWFYLLTGPETTSLPGVIVAGRAQLAEAMGWPQEAFDKAFGEVFTKGMAKADWKARLVWLPNSTKYQKPQSPNVVLYWGKLWLRVPECELQTEIYQHLKAFAEALPKGYAEAFGKAFKKLTESLNLNLTLNQTLPTEESNPAAQGSCRQANSIPGDLNTEAFRTAWGEWLQHRREIRKPLKPTTAAKQLKMLAGLGPERAVACINRTIEKGWVGLRPEDDSPSPGSAAVSKDAPERQRPVVTTEYLDSLGIFTPLPDEDSNHAAYG